MKSKPFVKNISCDFRCRSDGKYYKSKEKRNRDNCWCE